jgi:hypothetical protein
MSDKMLLDSLEPRLFFAQTPANIRPDSIGRAFDIGERQALLARLDNLPGNVLSTLNANLSSNKIGAFDSNLLAYMRTRSAGTYFFSPGNADSIADYANTNLGVTSQIQRADIITDDRLFPEQSSVSSYDVQLPADINWGDTSKSDNPEFINALNRQAWWVDLAQSFRYTGNTKYINELMYQLADWSQENPTFTLPDKKNIYPRYAFDISIRVENWLMAYNTVLGSSAWTGAANSLAVYKLLQQGDVLSTVSASLSNFENNRTIAISRSALYIGIVFPDATRFSHPSTDNFTTTAHTANNRPAMQCWLWMT